MRNYARNARIGAENGQNLKPIIEKSIITQKSMPQNHAHKIVRSLAMYYQNLNVIREFSKK